MDEVQLLFIAIFLTLLIGGIGFKRINNRIDRTEGKVRKHSNIFKDLANGKTKMLKRYYKTRGTGK